MGGCEVGFPVLIDDEDPAAYPRSGRIFGDPEEYFDSYLDSVGGQGTWERSEFNAPL